MESGVSKDIFKIAYSVEFERAIRRWKKDRKLFHDVERQMAKILREPHIGKPLRYSLKNRRRVHVGSFVLIYEFHANELRFIDFVHNDRVYKKYHVG